MDQRRSENGNLELTIYHFLITDEPKKHFFAGSKPLFLVFEIINSGCKAEMFN